MTLLEQLTQQAKENGGNVDVPIMPIINKLFTHQIKQALGSLDIVLHPYENDKDDIDAALVVLYTLLPTDLRITLEDMRSKDGLDKAYMLQNLLKQIKQTLTSKE